MAEERRAMPHNVILEDRKRLMLTGVLEVESFDEESVILSTELGGLTIRGSGLHISKFNVENGEISMDGNVFALVYTTDHKSSAGFFKKLFQ